VHRTESGSGEAVAFSAPEAFLAESVSRTRDGQAVQENVQMQTAVHENYVAFSAPESVIIRAVGSQIKTVPNPAESHPNPVLPFDELYCGK
jgi:hypothetical protein